MQGYADRLSDEEVAVLASFVRSGWGKPGQRGYARGGGRQPVRPAKAWTGGAQSQLTRPSATS